MHTSCRLMMTLTSGTLKTRSRALGTYISVDLLLKPYNLSKVAKASRIQLMDRVAKLVSERAVVVFTKSKLLHVPHRDVAAE
jgi:hypothetical protein